DAAFKLVCILSVNGTIDCRWYQDVARHGKKCVRVDMVVLSECPQGPLLKNVLFGGLDIYSFRIVDRRRCVANTNDFDTALVGERQSCHRTNIAESLHNGRA